MFRKDSIAVKEWLHIRRRIIQKQERTHMPTLCLSGKFFCLMKNKAKVPKKPK